MSGAKGRSGRRPLPTQIHRLRGSYRKDRHGAAAVKRNAPGKPRCPQWLSDRAKTIWKATVPKLIKLGIVGSIDEHTLSRYCIMYVQWLDCQKFLNNNGSMLSGTDKNGNETTREYPQVRQARSLHKELLAIEREFGMNPSARASLKVELPPRAK